jgi:hypothetical protein
MKALKYTQLGQILANLDMPEEYLESQVQEGEFLLKDAAADDSKQYVDINTLSLVDFPPKPDSYSIWNWETKQWQEPENYQQLLFNEAASKVKQKRQQLLATTDWTDTVSASTRLENYNAWQFYRQQLRDITTQEGYPFNVVWPTQPV